MRHLLRNNGGLRVSGHALGTMSFGEARSWEAGEPGQSGSPQPVDPAVAREAVIREVSTWAGVTVHDHRFARNNYQTQSGGNDDNDGSDSS